MFVIYKLSEYSGEADYFVRFLENGRKFYSTIGDAMSMPEDEADKLIKQGVAKYKEKINNN